MQTSKRGFTLTELTVAIAFVSILLLTIAVVTMNMVQNYHKGLTMKSINTVGLDLIDEFSSAVSESPVFDAEALCKSLGDIDPDENGAKQCMDDHAEKFIHQQFYKMIKVTKNGAVVSQRLPVAGVFCTGKYSYVWNTGYIISQEDTNHTMSSGFYSDGFGIRDDKGNYFRLRKYPDTGRNFCRNNFPFTVDGETAKHYPKYDDKNGYHYLGNSIDDDSLMTGELRDVIETSMNGANPLSKELINVSDLAIYSLTINSPTVNEMSGRSLYTGSFVLGSITGDIEIKEDYSSCKLDGVSTFDVEYCATNKFNFAMRAMGGNSNGN